MANYGPRHTIQDEYGNHIQVDVALQSDRGATVDLSTTVVTGTHPASTRIPVTIESCSPFTPDQARKLAKQLEAAASEAERYGP